MTTVLIESTIKQLSKAPIIDVFKYQDKTALSTIMKYQNKYCCDIFLGLIALFLGSVASFAVPGLLGTVVDAMLKNEQQKIRDYCLYMIGICVISGIASGARGRIFNLMSYKIARDIKYDLFWYLVRKDVTFFDEKKTGDILSRISSDVAVL